VTLEALLGEPIREVRQAIKDLLYRNRQQRIAGELNLARQQLAILRDHGLLAAEPEEIKELIVQLAPRTPLAKVLRSAQGRSANGVLRPMLPAPPPGDANTAARKIRSPQAETTRS
jgi:hypothetical protein